MEFVPGSLECYRRFLHVVVTQFAPRPEKAGDRVRESRILRTLRGFPLQSDGRHAVYDLPGRHGFEGILVQGVLLEARVDEH